MTSHFTLLCYFFVILFGLFSLTSASVITIVTGDIILRYTIFFYTIYTLEILKTLLRYYIVLNLPHLTSFVTSVSIFGESLLHIFMVFSIVLLIHFLTDLPKRRIINRIVLVIAVVAFGFHLYLKLFNDSYGIIVLSESYNIDFADIVFLLFILYAIIIGLLRMRFIEDEQKKIVLKKLVIVGVVFFPGLVYDSLVYSKKMMIIAPVIYFFISVLMLYYLIRFYLKNYYLSSEEAEENRDDFFQRFNISEREKDTLQLLLKGYSNRKIGDTLYISISTVKSHVYSVFKKTGVTSRFELIHLLKETDPPKSTL